MYTQIKFFNPNVVIYETTINNMAVPQIGSRVFFPYIEKYKKSMFKAVSVDYVYGKAESHIEVILKEVYHDEV